MNISKVIEKLEEIENKRVEMTIESIVDQFNEIFKKCDDDLILMNSTGKISVESYGNNSYIKAIVSGEDVVAKHEDCQRDSFKFLEKEWLEKKWNEKSRTC